MVTEAKYSLARILNHAFNCQSFEECNGCQVLEFCLHAGGDIIERKLIDIGANIIDTRKANLSF